MPQTETHQKKQLKKRKKSRNKTDQNENKYRTETKIKHEKGIKNKRGERKNMNQGNKMNLNFDLYPPPPRPTHSPPSGSSTPPPNRTPTLDSDSAGCRPTSPKKRRPIAFARPPVSAASQSPIQSSSNHPQNRRFVCRGGGDSELGLGG